MSLHLPGALDPRHWSLNAPHGPVPQVLDEVFPILKQTASGEWTLIGTGFYVSVNGLFVTAKHVLEDVLDPANDEQTVPIAIFHFLKEGVFPSNNYLIRPIASASMSRRSDVALGVAMGMTNNGTKRPLVHNAFRLRIGPAALPGPAATYAYPDAVLGRGENGGQTIEFTPALYAGTVDVEYPNGRDRVLMPWPSFGLTMHMHGGASGGPVIDADSHVFAVNDSSMDGAEDVSFAASIADLFDCYIKDGAFLGEESRERIMLSEAVAAGVVAVDARGGTLPAGDHTRARNVCFTKMPAPGGPTLIVNIPM